MVHWRVPFFNPSACGFFLNLSSVLPLYPCMIPTVRLRVPFCTLQIFPCVFFLHLCMFSLNFSVLNFLRFLSPSFFFPPCCTRCSLSYLFAFCRTFSLAIVLFSSLSHFYPATLSYFFLNVYRGFQCRIYKNTEYN